MERRFLALKSHPVKIHKRAEGAPASIVGYGAVFYNAADPGTQYEWQGWSGTYRERIMPGCFDRALREDDVRGLFNHDPNCVLGRISAGTMKLSIDMTGLLYDINPPATTAARDVMESIDRGDITGSSFAFVPTEIRWTELMEDSQTIMIREIMQAELYDVGPVTYPAYGASTTGIRAAGDLAEAEKSYREWKAQTLGAAAECRRRLAAYRARAVEVEI